MDAERCGRSFDAQVVAILRRHYGEDVDIAASPELVLSLARGSLQGLSAGDVKELNTRWIESEKKK